MIKGKRYITINTDAGFKDNRGTFAYYIRSDKGVISNFGVCNPLLYDNSSAEMDAILRALKSILERPELCFHSDIVHINTDSMVAIYTFKSDFCNNHYKEQFNEFKRLENILTKTYHLKVQMKHVKAHTGISDNRSLANRWCDMKAREARNLIK